MYLRYEIPPGMEGHCCCSTCNTVRKRHGITFGDPIIAKLQARGSQDTKQAEPVTKQAGPGAAAGDDPLMEALKDLGSRSPLVRAAALRAVASAAPLPRAAALKALEGAT